MERNAVANGSLYRMRPQGIRLPSLIKVPLGIDFITSPYNVDLVEFSDLVEYSRAVLEVAEHAKGLEPEFIDGEGWQFLSDDETVISQTCLEHDGTVASDNEDILFIFQQAVVDEITKNPKRYGRVDIEEVARIFADQYKITERGYFTRIEGEVNVVKPRASVYGIDYSDSEPEVEEQEPIDD
jgi:hypothetical protein